MNSMVRIGVIGDYDGRPSHAATNKAISHCASYLGLKQETQWLPTDSLETGNKPHRLILAFLKSAEEFRQTDTIKNDF